MSRSAAGATTTTYSYAPGTHQVTGVTSTGPGGVVSSSFAYDAAGNTTTRDVGDDAVQTLTWDVEGELAQVSAGSASDTYVYTADGERLVRRQGGSTTVYLPGGQELTATGGTVKATRYYAFNGATVAVRTGPGTTGVSTLVADHHGTAGLSIANTTRQVSRRYTDPYGAPRGAAAPSWAGDHGFLDKPTDTTGLVAIGARYYDPALGRFASVDPVMDLADPQQWHGYAYANNNPITWSDPTGLAPMIDGAWSAGAARAGKANPIKAQPASVQRRIPVTVVGPYFAVQGGAARAVKDAVVGTFQSLPPVMAYDWLQYARNDLGRDWAQMRATPGGYGAWAGGRISDTWNAAFDAVTRAWRTGDAYGIADQGGYIVGMAAVTIGGGKVLTRGRAPAANTGDTLLSTASSGGRRPLPMNMETVCGVACKYGIDISDVTININKTRAGYAGSTARDGTITLTRSAFASEEQLARTLFHERFHVNQIRSGMGYPASPAAAGPWESAAYAAEEAWWSSR